MAKTYEKINNDQFKSIETKTVEEVLYISHLKQQVNMLQERKAAIQVEIDALKALIVEAKNIGVE